VRTCCFRDRFYYLKSKVLEGARSEFSLKFRTRPQFYYYESISHVHMSFWVGSNPAPIPLISTAINADILDSSAEVKIIQKFVNNESNPIEVV
jgi:hypothetical protein